MTGRLLAPVLAGAFLALAPLAAGSGQALSATGTISGSGGSYTLTLKNTGDETINCLSLFAPAGVTVTTASGPPQTLRFSDGTGFGYGGGQGIAPGADAAFT